MERSVSSVRAPRALEAGVSRGADVKKKGNSHMSDSVFGCGCKWTMEHGVVTTVEACEEHRAFGGVKRALRILRDALGEAHEQLPPGPPPVPPQSPPPSNDGKAAA